jgi:hypothetical protein
MSKKASRLKIALTAAKNAALTLPAGTLVDVTDTGAIVRHNGSTAGGVALGGGGAGAAQLIFVTSAPTVPPPTASEGALAYDGQNNQWLWDVTLQAWFSSVGS